MRVTAEQKRRLGTAVGVSVAVHALVLSGIFPAPRESVPEPLVPPPLLTRLVELPGPAEPAPVPEDKKRPEPRRAEPRREAQKPAPPLAKPAAVAPAPAAPPVSAAPAEPAPLPPVTAVPQAPPAPAGADLRAAEAATAAQYRLQLIAYAQRNKPPYPRMARENNWTGEVTLEISLRADGQAELGLRKGSGYEVLDKLALDTYQQALRAVPVPPALRGKPVRLDPLRLIYNLTE